GAEIGEARVSGLNWSFDDNNVPQGVHRYSAIIRNSDATESAAADEYIVTVDGTAPRLPVIAVIAGDNVISETEAGQGIAVTGSAEPGSRVQVGLGDLVQTVVAASGGAYSAQFAPTQLPPPGMYTVTARAVDDFGNTSAVAQRSVVFEEPAVAVDQSIKIETAVDDVAAVVGELGSGGVTNDSRPALSGTLGEPLQEDDVVIVFRNGQSFGEAQVVGTNWTIQSARIADGIQNFTARVVAEDGTVRATTSEPFELTIDTAAPARPVFNSVEGNNVITEAEAADGVQLSGRGEAGATIEATWFGEQVSGLVDGDGTWDLVYDVLPAEAVAGAGVISVVQTDDAGNASTARARSVFLQLSDVLNNENDVNSLGVVQSQEDLAVDGGIGLTTDSQTNMLLDDLFAGANGVGTL
ncbi:MAG: Ig-like domain-containing protein, partial [Burkholderiaceae bacterium]